jgi:hypothetical protein
MRVLKPVNKILLQFKIDSRKNLAETRTVHTVRNGHGNLDFYWKFTKNRLCSFVHSMGKKVP